MIAQITQHFLEFRYEQDGRKWTASIHVPTILGTLLGQAAGRARVAVATRHQTIIPEEVLPPFPDLLSYRTGPVVRFRIETGHEVWDVSTSHLDVRVVILRQRQFQMEVTDRSWYSTQGPRSQPPSTEEFLEIIETVETWGQQALQAACTWLARLWPADPLQQAERILLTKRVTDLWSLDRIPPLTVRNGMLDLRDRCPDCPDPVRGIGARDLLDHLRTERHLTQALGIDRKTLRALKRALDALTD